MGKSRRDSYLTRYTANSLPYIDRREEWNPKLLALKRTLGVERKLLHYSTPHPPHAPTAGKPQLQNRLPTYSTGQKTTIQIQPTAFLGRMHGLRMVFTFLSNFKKGVLHDMQKWHEIRILPLTVLFEHSAHSFRYCLWLLLHYSIRAEYLQQRQHGQQGLNINYLALYVKFVDASSKGCLYFYESY